MRRLTAVVVLFAGLVGGYSATIVFGGPSGLEPSSTPEPGPVPADTTIGEPTAPPPTTATAPTTSAPTTTTTTTTPVPDTYLVWSTGGLTATLSEGLSDRFDDVSVVKGDVVELAVDGGAIPLDALAIDPVAHRPFDPGGSLRRLRPGTIVLGETSAEIRRAVVGDDLVLAGRSYEIVGIVPDEVVAAAEVVFARSDPDIPVTTDRFALLATTAPRTEVEEEVRSLYDGPAALRVRTDGETPWLRHGDAVLPQVFVKHALGEFSYSGRSGSSFVQDDTFRTERIVAAEVPVLGEVVCHEVVVAMLTEAMTRLIDEGLAHLVDPGGFAGCWAPRFIQTASGASSGVSRHAWGAAVDINAPANPLGSAGTQDPRLIEIMRDSGFTWGGDWLVPDPMHFEYGIG